MRTGHPSPAKVGVARQGIADSPVPMVPGLSWWLHMPPGKETVCTDKEVMRVLAFRLTGCHTGLICACGALARDGGDRCVKCAARARWSRRKARRAYEDG
jgi:hypothetical protein